MSKIINFSEAASIAIHGMILIAKAEGKISVIQIAERTGSSKHHVAKIMQRLVKENYLTSNRGPLGGFVLKKLPEEISLLEIFEAIEGKIEIQKCLADNLICTFDSCIMNNIATETSQKFIDFFQSKTLKNYL